MLFSTQLSSSQLQSLGSCDALQLHETWRQGTRLLTGLYTAVSSLLFLFSLH